MLLNDLTKTLTVRDTLRVESLLNVALHLSKGGAFPRISGSVALMLHRKSKFRVPGDLDLGFDNLLALTSAREYLLSHFDSAVIPEDITLFDGKVVGTELSLLCRDASGQALDRVACQLVLDDNSAVVVEPITIGQQELCIETLASLTAAKVDAVFKHRINGTVSSRCRDLFDMALMLEAGALPPSRDVSYLATSMLPGPPSAEMAYPREWLPVWRDLKRMQDTNMSLAQAWAETLSYARSLWDVAL
ncbi:hypothetical protein ACIPY2_05800 [Paenarthrobacter sp. NPDC089675]|uniref:hypothetical protein n=1 Tax=Paenarthrobacter sp. NPDC089675 TaxID=3364376 RepID=UPI003822E04D